MVNLMMANNNGDNPFADYMWMGDMDKFDQQVEDEIQEEEFIKSCIESLLDEEEEQTVYYEENGNPNAVNEPTSNQIFDPSYVDQDYNNYNYQTNQQVPINEMGNVENLAQDMNSLYIQSNNHQKVQQNKPQNGVLSSSEPSESTAETNTKIPATDILSKTSLNVNAQPFMFKPKVQFYATAQEFHPQQGFTTRPSNVCYEMPSHCKPPPRWRSGNQS